MAERERRVISLVGGGGKTTTMYALAEIFREEGKKVIVTTSTHLQTPPEEIRAWNIEEVRSLWKFDQIAVIGTDCESNKNLAAGDQAAVNQMENKKSVKKMRMPDNSFFTGSSSGSGGCTKLKRTEQSIFPVKCQLKKNRSLFRSVQMSLRLWEWTH